MGIAFSTDYGGMGAHWVSVYMMRSFEWSILWCVLCVGGLGLFVPFLV